MKQVMQQFKDRVSTSTVIDDLLVEQIWIDWTLGENVDGKFS